MNKLRVLSGVAAAFAASCSMAQNIERVRLTDNDLSRAQIHAEVQQMDMAIRLAGPLPAVAPPVPAPAAPAAPAAGLTGFFGALPGSRGGVGGAQTAGFLGNLAAGAAAQAATQQAPAATAPGAVSSVASTGMVAQAQARKDHLTQLFLGKGCKVSALP